MNELEVTVSLSNDQAFVLSDWLDRMLGTERFDLLGVGQMPRRSRPHRASGPVTERAISGWVEEEKLVTVCLARQEGCGEVIVVVRGGFDDVLAARIETLLDLS